MFFNFLVEKVVAMCERGDCLVFGGNVQFKLFDFGVQLLDFVVSCIGFRTETGYFLDLLE